MGRRLVSIGLAIALVALAGACGSDDSSSSSTTTTAAAASGSKSTSSTNTTQHTGTSAGSHSGDQVSVNLTFTGTKNFTAKGSKGRCGQGTLFNIELTESDYPGIGQSYSMAQFSAERPVVDIKWVIDAAAAYGAPLNADIRLSPDHKTVVLDVELEQFHPVGQPGPGPEHVKGVIICP